uniref:Uncharacterized protein n=1 Tax=Globodera rostochiensis TaxID=31243 RepID=A0A914GT76_GLORO
MVAQPSPAKRSMCDRSPVEDGAVRMRENSAGWSGGKRSTICKEEGKWDAPVAQLEELPTENGTGIPNGNPVFFPFP